MKTQTVTIDTSRLMAAAEKAIEACQEFTKACEAFGSDPRDVDVAPHFQRALVTTIEQTPSGDVVHRGDWEEFDEMPLAVRTALLSKMTETFIVGKYIYRIAQ